MQAGKKKIIRASTVPTSLETFCKGLLHRLAHKEGYDVLAVSSSGESLKVIEKREEIRTAAVEMRRQIAPVSDLKSLWKLFRLFRRERPDMVHSITPKAGLLCMMAAWAARVPVRMHTFTGLVFPTASGLKKKILILTDKITCACATHITPEGEGVKADLINYGITRKPLNVLGHGNIRGIDLAHYNLTPEVERAASDIRKPGFTFIFIGRIVGDKGINELIEAFKRLLESHPDARLLLVGRYENLDPISDEALRAIDSCENICAVGSQADVRPYLAASDALVFPSYREGFPNVVIEAGALGLPSIVTDINGSREIIIDGKNGIIIPPRNSDALLLAMKRMIENPDETARMARNARPLIESRYEIGYVQQCLIDHYSEVLR